MSAKDNLITVGGEPRIDFLPPEIRQKKATRRTIRGLVMLGILVVAACVVAYVGVTTVAITAQLALASEQQRTQDLLQQQREYADARALAEEVGGVRSARLVSSANEIEWREYFATVRATVPEGGTVQSIGATLLKVGEERAAVADVLHPVSLATVTVSATFDSLASIAAWLDNIENLDGFEAYGVGPATLGDAGYDITVVVGVGDDARSKKYFTELDSEESQPAESAATEEED